jgi:ligand-binding sensor domain-containing protein
MRYAVCIIILFLLSKKNNAQSFPNIQFAHLADKEGLSNNNVNAIVQDNDGFIWIGTSDGLNRFDGYRVRSFYQIPRVKNSLVYNGISNLACDKGDGIWICTTEGISYYKKLTGQFYNFRHNPSDSNSLKNDEYANVYLADDSTAWVTNTTNLYHFNRSLGYELVQTGFKLQFDKKETFSYKNITEDRQHQLWGYTAGTLFLLDKSTMRPRKCFNNCPGTINAIYQDSHLQYWVGSFYGGLLRFDPASDKFENIPLSNKSSVVNSITEWKDKQGSRWIVAGTDGGIILVDPVTLKNKVYQYEPGFMAQYSLSGNNISSVLVDRQNILWIGTDHGVSYVRPSQQQFELSRTNISEDLPQVASDYVYSCDENRLGLWFTTWLHYGIYLLKPGIELPVRVALPNKKGPNHESSDSLKPFFVLCEGDSVVWLTTENSLVEFNLKAFALQYYYAPGTINPIGLRTIIPVNDSTWWIRTRNNGANGLYIFNPRTRKFVRHFECDNAQKFSVPPFIMNICLGHGKQIFLGTRDAGLFTYDTTSERFINLLQFTDEIIHTHSNTFESIREDRNGLLWIGTYKGLLAFDPASKKIVRDYSEDALIGGVEISALRFDSIGNLWMNSARGLFCLTTSGQFKHYGSAEGLPNNFDEGVLTLAKDGYIYSGFRNFLVRFKPDQVLSITSPVTKVHFTDASVMDQPYFFQNDSKGEKEMSVAAGQNRFSVDFSIMNFDNNNEKRYYYQLDGVTNSWQQNENGHLVFYNIAPGKYKLHVKGGDAGSPTSAQEDTVMITVNAFWWQTKIFWFGCIASAILLAGFLVRRNIANIRKRAEFKQRLTEMEMTALRAQMNPHFIFNSLNSIENFIMQNKEREASDFLNKFARLIRIILENSKHNLITISRDMEALQLYVDLEQFRFNNKFSYQLQIEEELMEDNYQIPPLLIQPFVENAIVHGLANSDHPNLRLGVRLQTEGDYVKYTIEDNGVGRKNAALYRMNNHSNHKSVGLNITRERINIFNSKQNLGDEVTIIDLYDEQGNAAGTRCEIRIKPV